MKKLVVLAALLLGGCASSETVYMKNAKGEEVKCGPYTDFGNIPAANETSFQKVRACMGDFERQGFHRVAK